MSLCLGVLSVGDAVADQLQRIIGIILALDPEKVHDQVSPDSHAQWDSLATIQMIMAIQDQFNVKLTTQEALGMKSIGYIRELLGRKGIVTL